MCAVNHETKISGRVVSGENKVEKPSANLKMSSIPQSIKTPRSWTTKDDGGWRHGMQPHMTMTTAIANDACDDLNCNVGSRFRGWS